MIISADAQAAQQRHSQQQERQQYEAHERSIS
jgi:hypothetical protein